MKTNGVGAAGVLERIIFRSAQVLSVLSIAFLMLMFVGEGGLRNFSSAVAFRKFAGEAGLLFLFFPVTVAAGMIVGWWRAGLGGGITVAGLAGFYLLPLISGTRLPSGPWFVIMAAPGILFLISSVLRSSFRAV